MKHSLGLVICFSLFINSAFAQTMQSTVTKSKFSVQLDENTIVRDAEGKRLPYQQVAQMISSRAYTLDAVRDNTGKIIEYKIRAKTNEDTGTRETTVNRSSHLEPAAINRGQQFPEFKLQDMDGNLISSSDVKGKVVVFNFWFTVCKPCVNEMQALNTLVEKYKSNKDIVFIAPDWEKKNTVKAFLKSKLFHYTICPEASGLINALKIKYYPTNLIVSKDGKVFSTYEGGLPGIEKTLEKDIETALKQ